MADPDRFIENILKSAAEQSGCKKSGSGQKDHHAEDQKQKPPGFLERPLRPNYGIAASGQEETHCPQWMHSRSRTFLISIGQAATQALQ